MMTIEGFLENPLVLLPVIFTWFSFSLLAYYTYKRSIQDEDMMRVVQLTENKLDDRFAYLLTIVTGWQPGASTTAKVSVKLFGQSEMNSKETQSRACCILDPSIQRFQTGGEDSFIMTTATSLGRLTHVDIWHDNTGASPNWFLNYIIIKDLRTNTEWKFICNSWVKVPSNCGILAPARKTLLPTSADELNTMKRYLLSCFLSKELRDYQLIVSIFTRPPRPTFNRVQRLACLFMVIQTMMLVHSLIISATTLDDPVIIGALVGVLMVPVHFIIVMLFKRSQPLDATLKRIRVKTDWFGDETLVFPNKDYQSDLQRLQKTGSQSFVVDAAKLEESAHRTPEMLPTPEPKEKKSKSKWKKVQETVEKTNELQSREKVPTVYELQWPSDKKRKSSFKPRKPSQVGKDSKARKSLNTSSKPKQSTKDGRLKEPQPKKGVTGKTKVQESSKDKKAKKNALQSATGDKSGKELKSKKKDTAGEMNSKRFNPRKAIAVGEQRKSIYNQNQNAVLMPSYLHIHKRHLLPDDAMSCNRGFTERANFQASDILSKPETQVTAGCLIEDGASRINEAYTENVKQPSEKRYALLTSCNNNANNPSFGQGDNLTLVEKDVKFTSDVLGVKGGNYLDHNIIQRSKLDIGRDAPPGLIYHPTSYWFPSCGIFIGWSLVGAMSIVSSIYTIFYASTHIAEKSTNWAVSMAVSLVILIKPLLVIVRSCIMVYWFGAQPLISEDLVCAYRKVKEDVVAKDKEDMSNYQPMTIYDVYNSLRKKVQELSATAALSISETWAELRSQVRTDQNEEKEVQKTAYQDTMQSFLKMHFDYMFIDILIYLVFTACVTLVVYGQHSPLSYWHHKSVSHLIVDGHYADMSLEDVSYREDFIAFLFNGLLPSLYPSTDAYKTSLTARTVTADLATHRVGSIRLRQIRVTNDSCALPPVVQSTIDECHAEYSKYHIDSKHYNGSWKRLSSNQLRLSVQDLNAWHYIEQDVLQSSKIYGLNTVYDGGGYVHYLQSNTLTDLASDLLTLDSNKWIDELTRAVIVDLTLYNPHVNLFTLCILVFEFTPIGNVQVFPHFYTMDLYKNENYLGQYRLWLELVLVFILVIYTVRELMKMFRYGLGSYFSSLYNVWDLIIVIMSISLIGVYCKRDIEVRRSLHRLSEKTSETGFVNLYSAAIWEHAYIYILAILQMLVVVKFLKLLKFVRRLLTLQMVLRKALPLLFHFNLELFVMVIAFATLGHFLFGAHVSGYRDLPTALLTQYNFLIGSWDYEMLDDASPQFAAWFFVIFIIIGIFFMLSMFVAILDDSIAEVHNKKAIQDIEVEVLEYFYYRVKKFFGRATDSDLDKIISKYYKKRLKKVRFA